MPSIGDTLRQQRVRGQQTAAEAAQAAGLPMRLLIALESGAVPLEEPRGLAYLRIYARHLGLDAEELLRGSPNNGNGRAPESDPREARWRLRHGTRPGDYGDRLTPLTPGRRGQVTAVPAASASPAAAHPAALEPASSRPPASSAPPTRRWIGFALLGAVIVAVGVAAGVVLWDAVAVQSLVLTVPFLTARRPVGGPDLQAPFAAGITLGAHRSAAAALAVSSPPRTP